MVDDATSAHEIGVQIVAELADTAANVVPGWLRRLLDDRLARLGRPLGPGESDDVEHAISEASASVVRELRDFLALDVDHQRTNPLEVLRNATRRPTAVLVSLGVPAVARDAFSAQRMPTDIYDLAPATWRDVDESLHEPGLMWGAWKAATVLARRRQEGKVR